MLLHQSLGRLAVNCHNWSDITKIMPGLAQGYEREEEALGLRQRLSDFARENAKFADVKRSLKDEVAQLKAREPALKGMSCTHRHSRAWEQNARTQQTASAGLLH